VSDRTIALSCSVGLFLTATAVALAAAEKPPPVGFLTLVVALAVLSAVTYVRLLANMRSLGTRRWGRFVHVAVEGLAGGLALAIVLTLAFRGGPEGSTRPADLVIWLEVVGVVGALAAIAVWAAALGLRARRG
jgi:Kef-type K+ transport system membrane component KefB